MNIGYLEMKLKASDRLSFNVITYSQDHYYEFIFPSVHSLLLNLDGHQLNEVHKIIRANLYFKQIY